VAFVIAEPCIGVRDGSCADVCPVGCIHSDDTQVQYFIDPATCIDCGACVTMCPVGAIFYEADVPMPWKPFTARNAAYFDTGSGEGRLLSVA
jgi:ferredoxin